MPIRLRLSLLFAIGSALVIVAFGTFVYLRVGQDLLATVDLGLRARVDDMVASIERDGASAVAGGGSLTDPDESFAQVLDADGRVVLGSRITEDGPLLPRETLSTIAGPTFFTRTIASIDHDPLRLLALPLRISGQDGFVVAGATLGDRRDALDELLASLAVGGSVAVAIMAAAGWLLVGGALRPVELMRAEAAAVSASEPDRRLSIPRTGDELARLAATLNAMLARLQQAVERERRFVNDASHELRTPLSVLRMELDLALRRARTREELEGALSAASNETDRLVQLAEDLLVLARAQHGQLPVRRENVSLERLMGTVAERYGARLGRDGIRLDLDVEVGHASLDPARVRQALENLIENAIAHTPRGGAITLQAGPDADAGTMRISVHNTGPGFPPSLLARAFEPFARSDSPHSDPSPTPGTGLGLAIVQAIARAHGGEAVAENPPGGGARVTLLLRR